MSTNPHIGKQMYLKIRNQCGRLAVLLPWLALFSAGIAEHPGPDWWWSISATYYQSPALVAIMLPACLVMYNYIGYDRLDNKITNLIALFGLGLAIFPCKVSWIPDGTRVGFFQIPIEISAIIHGICSALFFFFIAFNSLFLFPKSKPGRALSPKKIIRNRIYRICGWSILILEAIFPLAALKIIPPYFKMIIEILLLNVFGFSWLVKGEFFRFLNDNDEAIAENQ